MSETRRPPLSTEELEECLELVREGHRLSAVARKFGVTRQALYMRCKRDPEFALSISMAEADAEIQTFRLLKAAAANGKSWQAFAWTLERRFGKHGWLSAVDKAKVASLRTGAQQGDANAELARLYADAMRTLPIPDMAHGAQPQKEQADPEDDMDDDEGTT